MQRGLIVSSRSELRKILNNVSYYRLSAYLYHYKKNDNTDEFIEGITLEYIWNLYIFDRQLRLLVIDLVERFEVAIRTQIINNHALEYGPFGYLELTNVPKMPKYQHDDFMVSIYRETLKSKEYFVKHFREKYKKNELPIWMVGELISFGTLIYFFEGLDNNLKQKISEPFSIEYPVFKSWLKCILYTRNLCAHHMPVWSRYWQVKPQIPNHVKPGTSDLWHIPVVIKDDNLFGILSVLRYLQKIIAPQSSWKRRFLELLNKYPDVPKDRMGFQKNWQESPIWQD